MEFMKKVMASLFVIALLFTPFVSSLEGAHYVYAKKAKPMDQKAFNKKVSELSKQIVYYKQYEKSYQSDLNNYRLYNAELFSQLFEEDTVANSDEEMLQYYLQLVKKFNDREDMLDDYLEPEEIDIISDNMYDVMVSTNNIDKLRQKIAQYDKNYNALVKAKNYDAAYKVKADTVTAYQKLVDILYNAIYLEAELYENLS
ncbi:hypothetical protein GGR02_003523 [Anoxybacillus voinovskiensis]|uniref:Uncharacterized protein n=1 Tax=Anoxybacteroides voinovskiense TaxID=230470 RepID=A0A840E1L6_9BACL|nr:hypothetical protein [Anoxybacillus voinovskiensis]MBB4075669.1 hypothetical protein [Anoxybacillus voinovskiensis]GGJ81363.1 hypothetical protein GCM10008982_33550 [Anoxybacillus voinovskiensis]